MEHGFMCFFLLNCWLYLIKLIAILATWNSRDTDQTLNLYTTRCRHFFMIHNQFVKGSDSKCKTGANSRIFPHVFLPNFFAQSVILTKTTRIMLLRYLTYPRKNEMSYLAQNYLFQNLTCFKNKFHLILESVIIEGEKNKPSPPCYIHTQQITTSLSSIHYQVKKLFW